MKNWTQIRGVVRLVLVVGPDGIEPSTSVLSGQRSTTELRALHLERIRNSALIVSIPMILIKSRGHGLTQKNMLY